MSMEQTEKEAREYLARIRRTISESNALISQAELRMAETDRLLESQGLTRAQVEAMSFSDEQLEKVNAELARRGLPQLDKIEPAEQKTVQDPRTTISSRNTPPERDVEDVDGDLENRRRKFNSMMGSFRL